MYLLLAIKPHMANFLISKQSKFEASEKELKLSDKVSGANWAGSKVRCNHASLISPSTNPIDENKPLQAQ